IAGAAGHDAERDSRAGDRRRDLHRGPVAAMADHHVEPLAARLLGDPPRITGALDRPEIDIPAAPSEDFENRGDSPRIRARRKGIGNEQRASHLVASFPEHVEAHLTRYGGRDEVWIFDAAVADRLE